MSVSHSRQPIDLCYVSANLWVHYLLHFSFIVLSPLSLSKGILEPPEGTKIYKDSWDFEPYLNTLNAAVEDEIFLHSSWIKEYFTWAGFKNYNLVVRVCSSIFAPSFCFIKIQEIPCVFSNLCLSEHS